MRIFLIGNGFDLYHRLPTKYINFLHTIDFLVKNYDESMDTVGKIFGDTRLQEQDSWIKLCYETHKPYFDETKIDPSLITATIEMAKKNLWYNYLWESYNRDVGWIDFEKEVSTVIDAFASLFLIYDHQNLGFTGTIKKMHDSYAFIVESFQFFLKNIVSNHPLIPSYHEIEDGYLCEIPLHSGYYELDKEKIAKALYDSLNELSVMLRDYLERFIENVVSIFLITDCIDYTPFKATSPPQVITFNYTTVYEKLCGQHNYIHHIHGNINSNIVLGINPTKEDETHSIDTTFLRFKKYYQRVLNRTDDDYLSAIDTIRSWKGKGGRNHLTVFGHSLDRTDQDVIRECFDASDTITVYYYEPEFHSAVRNLVEIYGKEEFDQLRRKKSLTFKPQPTVDWEAYKNVQLQIPPL